MTEIVRVWICGRDGVGCSAVCEGERWACPLDGGDLGDASGYRAVRVGSRCPVCGAVVYKTEEARTLDVVHRSTPEGNGGMDRP